MSWGNNSNRVTAVVGKQIRSLFIFVFSFWNCNQSSHCDKELLHTTCHVISFIKIYSYKQYSLIELPFIELPWELLALHLFSVVNAIGNATAWPDKLGTSPMAYDGANGSRSGKREGGVECPVSMHQIQPGCGEWAGWRGTGRPNLTRETKLSGERGQRKFRFPLSADHEQDWQTYPVLLSLLNESDDQTHTYTHHWSPIGWIHYCSIGRLVWQGRVAWLFMCILLNAHTTHTHLRCMANW